MRRYPREFSGRIRPTKSHLEAAPPNDLTSDPFSKWSQSAGLVIQFATLLLLLWGYFYTVIPVFQKERLAEQVAQLEHDISDKTIALESLRHESSQLAKLVRHQAEVLQSMTKEQSDMLMKERTAEDAARVASARTFAAQRDLKSSMQQTEIFQWTLLRLKVLLLDSGLGDQSEFINGKDIPWPDNLNRIRATISKLKRDNRLGTDFTNEMIDKLLAFVESHQDAFACSGLEYQKARQLHGVEELDARRHCIFQGQAVLDSFFDSMKAIKY
jgi:hypothetical protein